MRRTKATLIYRRTKNLRAVQLLLGHSKLESTARYPGIEVDDALEIPEQAEIDLDGRVTARKQTGRFRSVDLRCEATRGPSLAH